MNSGAEMRVLCCHCHHRYSSTPAVLTVCFSWLDLLCIVILEGHFLNLHFGLLEGQTTGLLRQVNVELGWLVPDVPEY